MPYSGADDKDLPENVKKLGKKLRKQWVEVFNSTISDGGDEAKAFKYANGVIKKQQKAWIDTWNVYDAQVSQDDAGYNPLGANDSKGCANCNWFISPDGCILVSGTISPTGISNFWLAEKKWESSPMEVVIVGDETKELDVDVDDEEIDTFVGKIKSLLSYLKGKVSSPAESNTNQSTIELPGDADNAEAPPIAPVQSDDSKWYFIKQADDRLRFFTIFSNNFKDKESETITEEAHIEFANWCEQNKQYPDVQLWHSGPQSKWAKVDWIDYSSGFVCASGLVDEGKEYIAERLSKEDVGVSHGFIGLSLPREKSILRYRSFEVSPLPRWASANSWTNFVTDVGEVAMPFSDKRKTWLKNISGLSDDQISLWERDVEHLSTNLKDMGIEFKDNDQAEQTALIQSMAAAMAEMAKQFKALQVEVAQAKKDLDTRVAEVFTAEIAKMPQGFIASKEKGTEVPPGERKDIPQPNVDWFSDTVLKGLIK